MQKRTKALQISPATKHRVYDRDQGRCVLCGAPGAPVAHFISRAQGGLGIEENVFTACARCHAAYDQTAQRAVLRESIMAYMRTKYDGWDDLRLTYRKA